MSAGAHTSAELPPSLSRFGKVDSDEVPIVAHREWGATDQFKRGFDPFVSRDPRSRLYFSRSEIAFQSLGGLIGRSRIRQSVAL